MAEFPKFVSVQALDDIDLNFKLVTSGLGDNSAEEAALGVRRAQRSTAYSLLKQVIAHCSGPSGAIALTYQLINHTLLRCL